MAAYPKRLIEVDLPIKRISAHARRENSNHHGHIKTLHIWWARRPLAACRAIICAALWPDPVDQLCPVMFRAEAARQISEFAKKASGNEKLAKSCSTETWSKWKKISDLEDGLNIDDPSHLNILRFALLDFIADFSDWNNCSHPDYLETSRHLTQVAHMSLSGETGTKPIVLDPFAGGGAIPLEALRVGAEVFASDLNPVSFLLNKVSLEYLPKYGQQLAEEVEVWGKWIREEAGRELEKFYDMDSDGAIPVAYLWARTITCEGVGCGATVPMLRTRWLAKKNNKSIILNLIPNLEKKCVDIDILKKEKGVWRSIALTEGKILSEPEFKGNIRQGSVTCPCCGYTTPVKSVRRQLKARCGGTNDAQLLCVVQSSPNKKGRSYRLANAKDAESIYKADQKLKELLRQDNDSISILPFEEISLNELRRISMPIYGISNWSQNFTCRQLLSIATLIRLLQKLEEKLSDKNEHNFIIAAQTCIALTISKFIQYNSSLCRWKATGESLVDTFGRQALPMVWDFAEANPFGTASGDFNSLLAWVVKMLKKTAEGLPDQTGIVQLVSAQDHPLPDDMVDAFITDPPYYDAVPYAYLSDYFYVWLRRSLIKAHPDIFKSAQVIKAQEIVVDRPHKLSKSKKDIVFYENELTKAFSKGCQILKPSGIGIIVFASKTTASWESVLQGVIDADLIITGSWPIDTEMETRVAAQGQARLASSVHLVCRPRENPDGSISQEVGDWRDVLQELPQRIHEWMPRLASEGVVGADAIFACLGPALEIFSRYSSVEKASGEQVTLKEYLEHVWAAVSKEALSMIFTNADTAGFEEDARLTAMWLWTLSTDAQPTDSQSTNDEDTPSKSSKSGGYILEYDAARKIAQGLGAHLEQLTTLVHVKGDKAQLLPVSDRAASLFGKADLKTPTKRKTKNSRQLSLINPTGNPEDGSEAWGDIDLTKLGNTVLDRVHQSMILFAAGRSEALKRFLVDEGVGSDQRYWTLAQALSALYPPQTDEKRWVDGVLARKKGLGF